MGLVDDIENVVGDNGTTEDQVAHGDFGFRRQSLFQCLQGVFDLADGSFNYLLLGFVFFLFKASFFGVEFSIKFAALGSQFGQLLRRTPRKYRDVSVLIDHIDVVVDDQRRAPGGREHVVSPIDLTCLCVEAMEKTSKIGDEKDIALDGHCSATAVHLFFKRDFPITSLIEFTVMPDCGGIRVIDRNFSRGGDHSLQAFVRNRLARIAFLHGQLRAHIASLEWVQTPQMPNAFTVFGVLARGDVDKTVANDWGGDNVISSAATARAPLGLLGVHVEFPEQFWLAIDTLVRSEAVHPTVTAGEDHLRNAPQFGNSRRRPLAVENVGARRSVSPVDFATVLIHGDEAGSFGRRELNMGLIDAIGSAHKQDVAKGSY